MGILDVIRGMENGPRGAPTPDASSGGPSKVTMALLALLAYKAWKAHSAANMATTTQQAPAGAPENSSGLGGLLGGWLGGQPGAASGGPGGGLGGLLSSGLAGGALGGLLSSGLRSLVGDMNRSGLEQHANSWIGTGPNQSISESDLAKAIGSEDLDKLSQQTGMPRDELLKSLQTQLPEAVNELTPEGRIPSESEFQKMI